MTEQQTNKKSKEKATEPKLTKIVDWQLHVVMAKKRIRTVTALHRMLLDIGYDISSAQLSRIISQRPQMIKFSLIDALLTVLDCPLSELLIVDEVGGLQSGQEPASGQGSGRSNPVKHGRARKEPVTDVISENVTGPKATAMPLPERKS